MQSIFKSKNFLLFVIVLVMFNNIEHCAYVHQEISRKLFGSVGLNWAHSVTVVIIIELSIIAFVYAGERIFSILFTAALFSLNILYYDIRGFWEAGQYENILAALIYSCLFTISIYMFSELLSKQAKKRPEEALKAVATGPQRETQQERNVSATALQREPQRRRNDVATPTQREKDHVATLPQRPDNTPKPEEPDGFFCECGRSFAKQQSLSAHKKHCKHGVPQNLLREVREN
ncbi:hypothetical protein FUAX_09970 [Fulvitalea axinellae]|uniref:C2H2-type domain-containing protein n=1 Tax=Fulvitalea axinellae TaxID=1182444 RepID=A0AAU9D8H5_9BACT|nr:hypothetical protein FUAX_09970 [Fulvitalea axinellae]